jgi:hypothetical protein
MVQEIEDDDSNQLRPGQTFVYVFHRDGGLPRDDMNWSGFYAECNRARCPANGRHRDDAFHIYRRAYSYHHRDKISCCDPRENPNRHFDLLDDPKNLRALGRCFGHLLVLGLGLDHPYHENDRDHNPENFPDPDLGHDLDSWLKKR